MVKRKRRQMGKKVSLPQGGRGAKKHLERWGSGTKIVSLKLWLQNMSLVKKGPLSFLVLLGPTCLLPSFVFSLPTATARSGNASSCAGVRKQRGT